MLTRNSPRLFAAVGGWYTVAEVIASRVVYLLAYLVTGRVVVSALIAVGAVLVFAVVRVRTDRNWWQAAGALLMVGVCATLAGSSGRGADFYLPNVLFTAGGGLVLLVSMLVRWPVAGVLIGRGARAGWRRDPVRRRRYQLCTAVFLAKAALSLAILVPLYLAGSVVPLGIICTLGGLPALSVCGYFCWRILRDERALTGAAPGAVPEPA
ncbi:hypothetical protein GCM10023192_00270 [Amycolatopsis samaneae]